MIETITKAWRPKTVTSNTLKSDKYGYTQEQLNRLGKEFVERNEGKELSEASTMFFDFVKRSERGRNAPGKPDIEKQQQEIKDRMPEEPVKGEVRSTKLSREDAISWYLANGKPTVRV